jgi:hypothetical protein
MALGGLALDSDAIASWCEADTGLHDFGATGFRDRLATLVRIMSENPDLQTADRQRGAVEDLVQIAKYRLLLEHEWQVEPRIREQRIERPLIVIGIPRAGTTLLHSLLAEDPAGRAPRAWEVLHPSPPPSLAVEGDGRRAKTREALKEYCLRAPGILIGHPYWDQWEAALMECEALSSQDLHNAYATSFIRTPAGLDFGGGSVPGLGDIAGTYSFHKAMLQQLQWGGPDRHWVLKGNRHAVALDQLRATYPDADVVWVHRHPSKTFASLMELMVVLREGRVGKPLDRKGLGPTFLDSYASGMDKAMQSREIERVYHLPYRDLVADPVAVIRAAYAHFGRQWTSEHEARMRAWLADPANRSNRRGTFHYELGWFGPPENNSTNDSAITSSVSG